MKQETLKLTIAILSVLAKLPESSICKESVLVLDLRLQPIDLGILCLRLDRAFNISFVSSDNIKAMGTWNVESLCEAIEKAPNVTNSILY